MEQSNHGKRLTSGSSLREMLSGRHNHQSTGGDSASNLQSKSYLSRLSRERKAAKTIGIIVGCFIACWTPFFTVYLLGAFCYDCTHSMVFTVFFWLGYGNSALNPFIYALYSRDFRQAFHRLLCCRRSGRRYAQREAGGRNGRVDRLIMMAQLHGPLTRPPDGRKNIPLGGGNRSVNMPNSVYMLRR